MKKTDKEEFGQFVTYMKKAAGWTTKVMAERTGFPYSTVRKYERGRIMPSNREFELSLREEVKKEIVYQREQRKQLV